jgi:DNA polymerase I
MVEGWVLDAYPDRVSGRMVVWLKQDDGSATRHLFDWSPVIHVHSSDEKLRSLEEMLSKPSYRYMHGGLTTHRESHYIRHGPNALEEVLAIRVGRSKSMAKIANSILSMGSWKDYEIFSVDPRPAQRFLHEMGVAPFSKVAISDGRMSALDQDQVGGQEPPPLKRASLLVNCRDRLGKRSASGTVEWAEIKDLGNGRQESEESAIRILREDFNDPNGFLQRVSQEILRIDPDILVTDRGDSIDFPALMSEALSAKICLQFGRGGGIVDRRRDAVTNWSYGQLLRSEAYHAIDGRAHVDFGHSFIAKEGGIEGLIEVSKMTGIPLQDLSRLSPGSAISAIQIRQSMDDGVLVPWKKNRAEDVKNGEDMLLADRGGLYLDPVPGVHRNVFELDFTSLFPSIIATRNISPETMDCVCCDSHGSFDGANSLPLDPAGAEQMVRGALLSDRVKGLTIPELGSHTCGRVRGFLGRVVAPIIIRRMELKALVKFKGDKWDKRQNVLKWLLVTCFGYTGYRNARFGRIECHEAICAWSREILLSAKDLAEEEGWRCLHAIVDSIWLVDDRERDREGQRNSIMRLMDKIESMSGIPIELEDLYTWIAFIPNKTTGVPSLTKYFAQGESGWKIRGVELRQHSTCKWVREIQEEILGHLKSCPTDLALANSIKTYLRRLGEMRRGEVPLIDLVIRRRVKKDVAGYKVQNLTYSALARGRLMGQENPPGRKIGFVVLSRGSAVPSERVRLESEVKSNSESLKGKTGDFRFYEALARRASFSILSPFGVSEDTLSSGGRIQTTLDEWLVP